MAGLKARPGQRTQSPKSYSQGRRSVKSYDRHHSPVKAWLPRFPTHQETQDISGSQIVQRADRLLLCRRMSGTGHWEEGSSYSLEWSGCLRARSEYPCSQLWGPARGPDSPVGGCGYQVSVHLCCLIMALTLARTGPGVPWQQCGNPVVLSSIQHATPAKRQGFLPVMVVRAPDTLSSKYWLNNNNNNTISKTVGAALKKIKK